MISHQSHRLQVNPTSNTQTIKIQQKSQTKIPTSQQTKQAISKSQNQRTGSNQNNKNQKQTPSDQNKHLTQQAQMSSQIVFPNNKINNLTNLKQKQSASRQKDPQLTNSTVQTQRISSLKGVKRSLKSPQHNQQQHTAPGIINQKRTLNNIQFNKQLQSVNQQTLRTTKANNQIQVDQNIGKGQNQIEQNDIQNNNQKEKAILPLGLRIPQSTRHHHNQNNFFRDELQEIEEYYAHDKDQEVQQVNERAQQAMKFIELQSPINYYQDANHNSGRQSKDGFQKRVSIHNKRGRNQPSQTSHHNRTPSQNNARQQLIRQSPQTQQYNNQEIMIINLSKKDDSFYGNDEDIYEMERLGNVMLLNQVKLKEESSLSLINDSNLIVTNEMLNRIQDPRIQICQSSMKNIDSEFIPHDLYSSGQFQTQMGAKTNRFGPIEQELDDSVSRINQSDFNNNPFLLQQRSLSLSSYNTFSNQQSIYRKTRQLKRPESGSPLNDFKSISSGKIMRRDSSTGHLFESPSERTILDVLGLCSTTTKHNNGMHLRDSAFMSIIPCNLNNGQGFNGQDVSEIFHVEGMNNQGSIINGNNGQAILMQSQYQNLEVPSKMQSLVYMNQSSNSQNPQILFNNHPGCNGSYTGDSFSTNKIINNFLDDKRKELEALQEVDRESDTTEQMTFSQHSREASPYSREDQNDFDNNNHGQNELMMNVDLMNDDFGLADSKIQYDDSNKRQGNDYNNLEENKNENSQDECQPKTLRRTSRIFEYYNNSKKDSLSKRKKKRRITSTNGGNNILSVQSCTRGSNIQLMSIRDILVDKDSNHQDLQQIVMTPSDFIQNKIDSSSLIETINQKDSLMIKQQSKFQKPQRSERYDQSHNILLNRKYSETHKNHNFNNLLSQSTPNSVMKTTNQMQTANMQLQLQLNEKKIGEFNFDTEEKKDLNTKEQSNGRGVNKKISQLLFQEGNQKTKSRNNFFSKTILTAAPQLIQRDTSQLNLKGYNKSGNLKIMLSDCNIGNNIQQMCTPQYNKDKSMKDLRTLTDLQGKHISSSKNLNIEAKKVNNLSQGRKHVKTARNLNNLSNEEKLFTLKHRNSLIPQNIISSQSTTNRQTHNMLQDSQNRNYLLSQNKNRMQSTVQCNQIISNEEGGLPKSHNGSRIYTLQNQQSQSNYSYEQQITNYQNQQIKDILTAVINADNDMNRTAPEDLSMSYMNTGNNTLEMKIQNAANIKTFDFRPSKQVNKQ